MSWVTLHYENLNVGTAHPFYASFEVTIPLTKDGSNRRKNLRIKDRGKPKRKL